MKKVLLSLAVAAFLVSCGGAESAAVSGAETAPADTTVNVETPADTVAPVVETPAVDTVAADTAMANDTAVVDSPAAM